jgi:RNA polymerase sigma factor (sigma-70 family)
MTTPFRQGTAGQEGDETLVARARANDRAALETLLARHQPWIFNIAVRMLFHHADAEDATQEILVRVLRALPSFRGESRFSTWLYRIAVNHILNVKKARWSASEAVCSFADAAAGLQRVPDVDPPDPATIPLPFEILVEEAKVGCVMGTLLCLDGRQRLVFILGTVFGVGDEVGAEIVGVTPVNFRQLLSRARRDLYEYLRGNCSLIEPRNSCRCARETRTFIQGGFVDPHKLRFTPAHLRRVRDLVDERAEGIREAYAKVADDVYRDHPFYQPAEQAEKVRQALGGLLDTTRSLATVTRPRPRCRIQ